MKANEILKVTIEDYGTLEGTVNTLNLISIAFSKAADEFMKERAWALSAKHTRISEEIYVQLKASGYYD